MLTKLYQEEFLRGRIDDQPRGSGRHPGTVPAPGDSETPTYLPNPLGIIGTLALEPSLLKAFEEISN